MDEMIQPVRTAGLVAFALAAVAFGLAWRPWRRDKPLAGGLWAGALALGGAYLAGQVLMDAWPKAWNSAVPKLLIVVGAATLLGLCDALLRWPAWLGWPLRALLLGGTLWYLFAAKLAAAPAAWLLGLGAAGLVFWWLLDGLAERMPGASGPLMVLPVVAGSAPVLFWAGNTTLPFFLVPVGVALVVGLVVALRAPSFSLARGGTTVLAVLLPSAWLIGYFLTHVKPVQLVLLALAPAAAWLTRVGPLRRLAPWQAVLLRVALVGIPVAVAVKLAYDGRPPEDPYGEYGY